MGSVVDAVQGPASQTEIAKPKSEDPATRPPVPDANHLFANNVRFLSMVAIIALHTIGIYSFLHHQEKPLTLLAAEQVMKFGSIAFFLVAGFLFGERVDHYKPLQYYGRRLKNVFLPWTVWYLTYSALCFAHRFRHPGSASDWIALTREALSVSLQSTPYWFVPNLLIALALLLMLRPILRDGRVGLVLMTMSLFYAVNIYGRWLPVEHHRAVFGFVFYLWLGAWCSWHSADVEKCLARVGMVVLFVLLAATYVLGVAETKLLLSAQSADPMNTLRISNQLYSVVAVLALFRLRRALWPRFVSVREHTFGLYLTHSVALPVFAFALRKFLPYLGWARFWDGPAGATLLILATFVAVYGSCLLLVRGLLSCRWTRWTVGLAGSRPGAAHVQPPLQKASFGRPASPGLPVRTDKLATVVGSN